MPILRCQKNKKKGFKFGKSGTCYTGSKALKKAKLQGRAIKRSQSMQGCCQNRLRCC